MDLQGLNMPVAGWWIARHWAAMAIALTCLSLVTFTALLLAKYIRICLNIFCDTPPPGSFGVVDFRPIYGEVVRFRSYDGTSLRGMWIPASGPYKGTIVFCHEYGFDMYSCGRYVRPLVEAGFDVFAFDFRGHGESSGRGRYKPLQWPSDKDMEDVLGAVAHVESALEEEGRPMEVGVFGISRGAGAALLAAHTQANIKAIVCDGAFSTGETLITYMKRWVAIFARIKLVYENHSDHFWRFLLWLLMRFAQPRMGCRYPSVSKSLKYMQPRPVFFIHGKEDRYIDVSQTRMLYAEAPDPKYLWVVEGAKHNQSVAVQPRQYARRTVGFFLRHLAGEAVDEKQITGPKDAEVA